MRDRGNFLDGDEDENTGILLGALSQMRRAANAAGYDTADRTVQAALIVAYGLMNAAMQLSTVGERIGDEVRRARKDPEGRYS